MKDVGTRANERCEPRMLADAKGGLEVMQNLNVEVGEGL